MAITTTPDDVEISVTSTLKLDSAVVALIDPAVIPSYIGAVTEAVHEAALGVAGTAGVTVGSVHTSVGDGMGGVTTQVSA